VGKGYAFKVKKIENGLLQNSEYVMMQKLLFCAFNVSKMKEPIPDITSMIRIPPIIQANFIKD